MTAFEEQWRRRFQRFATDYRSDHEVSGWSLTGLRRRVAMFEGLLDRGLLPPRARVLELGCGAGTYVRLLAQRGHSVTGLDYSLPSLRRAAAADLGSFSHYAAGSAEALPFGSGSFQAVICIGVLQVVERQIEALGEMARVVEPGGIVLVETLNRWNPLATWRRLVASVRGEPSRLRYGSPRALEREMASCGLRARQRASIVLPPRSLSSPGRPMPWLERFSLRSPGAHVISHAFWIIAVRA